jgi:SPP1 family predicted phage head-tail adaptor
MKIGTLNRRVTIQQSDGTQDSIGQPSGWSTLATVWANVLFLNGAETLRADAPTSVAKASIRIRRRTDVTASMRLVLGATVFQIKAVLPDEQGKQYVDLACEVVA